MQAFCAGSSTYMIATVLGFKDIYLLGLDLALDQTTLQTHNSNYSYTLKAKEDADQRSFRDSIIEIEGNLRPSVKSTPNFALSIRAINEISTHLKQPYQNVYNLNDGAKFTGTTAAKSQDITHCADAKISLASLLTMFQNNSAASLTRDEKLFIHTIYNTIQEIQHKVESFAQTKFDNATTFLTALSNFENAICLCEKKECVVVALLMENYMHFVSTYIFDAFNNQIQPDFSNVQKDLTENLKRVLHTFATPFQSIL